MTEISSILVALGREGDPAGVVAKAVFLARRSHARIDIFLCEAESAYALQHQYDVGGSDAARRSGLNKLKKWLDRLWTSLDAGDTPVTLEAVYETPLCESIARKVRLSKPDLVVRGIGAGNNTTFSVADRDLMYSCSAPLLFTRGKPWRSPPHIAAALDISGDESPEHICAILRAAGSLAAQCGADLEVLYASRFVNAAPGAVQSARESLCGHAGAAGVKPREAHIVTGDPAYVIPQFVVLKGYELLVLGALSHRKNLTTMVGTLTGRLVETVDCDLLLIKPATSTISG